MKRRKKHVSLSNFSPARSADSTRDASRIAARAAKLSRVLSLTQVEDLRRYHHDPQRPFDPLPAPRPAKSRQPYHLVSGALAKHSVRPVRGSVLYDSGFLRFLPGSLRDVFHKPRQTIVCVRRRSRRAVLFALQRIGHGAGRLRKARWSESSYIRCK